MTVFFNHNNNFLGIEFDVWNWVWYHWFFEIDIENVRNTRYRDHGGAIQWRITEIAIYKFDGHEIVDQFISLVNPEIQFNLL
jgi:hypothetical protein